MANVCNIMTILFSITLGISLLLISLLIKQANTNNANLFLIILLATVSIGCLYSLYLPQVTNLFVVSIVNAMPALFGTLTFLYVKKSLYTSRRINIYLYLVYFLPFLVALILSYFCNKYPTYTLLDFILNVLVKIVSSLAFMVATFTLIKKYRASIFNTFSNIEHIELNWLDFFVKSTIAIFSIYLILMILFYADIKEISNFQNVTAILLFVFIFLIGYYGISNSNTFHQLSVFELIETSENDMETEEEAFQNEDLTQREYIPTTEEFAKEQMKNEKSEKYYQELLFLLKEKKPYLDENLTIDDLAKQLNIHSKYLSSLINKKFDKSFFDLINHYRVLEFNEKVILPENKNFTYLSIAFGCGFGSKSSFNRAYKNEMNISPSEFVKNHLIK